MPDFLQLASPPAFPFRRPHLVGICGAGMKALAECLHDRGCRVAGSDQSVSGPIAEGLRQLGISVHAGHSPHHVATETDVLIHSAAVPSENPERRFASAAGLPQFSYTRALSLLAQERSGIAVAGTHGKSTIAAMTVCILSNAGLDPSVVVGAESLDRGRSGWTGRGEHFIVEACEYRRGFLELAPHIAAISSVEPDHFDCYADIHELGDAFSQFAKRVDGILLLPHDQRELALGAQAKVETFGPAGADWTVADVRPRGSEVRFTVLHRSEFFADALLRIPGRHNVLNALIAVALAHHASVPAEAISRALAQFRGIRRRYEQLGTWRGATVIDDYAHHPTAVAATLETAREQFPGRRICCAFQPHQVSRTRALLDEFAASFDAADEVLLVPVYAARETADAPALTASEELASRIARSGRDVRVFTSLDRLAASLDDVSRPGDVLILMGAGNIDQIRDALSRSLQRDPRDRQTAGSADQPADRRPGSVFPRAAG